MILTKEIVCNAITTKHMVLLKFSDGHVRLVEPYAFGRSRVGEYLLLVFQVRGPATGASDWRLVRTAEVETVQTVEQRFAVRSSYHPNPAELDGLIYCQVTS